jgi:hypothetical protein
MSRLIDADALKKDLDAWVRVINKPQFYNREETLHIIDKAPTVEPKRGEWINIKERLPEAHGHYLAVVKRTAPDILGGNETRIKIMRWMGEDWRYAHYIPEWINKAITDIVTHWQPLPQPPKTEEQITKE